MWPRSKQGVVRYRKQLRQRECRLAMQRVRRLFPDLFAPPHAIPSRKVGTGFSPADCGAGVSPARILEFGSGGGHQIPILAEMGRVTATDVYLSKDLIWPRTDCTYALADIAHAPFPDQSFDLVFSNHVLEHVKELDQALDELHRIGRPGAVYAFAMPTRLWLFLCLPAKYLDRAKRLLNRLIRPSVKQGSGFRVQGSGVQATASGSTGADVPSEAPTAEHGQSRWKAMLLPGGHGEYPILRDALRAFRRSAWSARFLNHGFEIVEYKRLLLYATARWPIIPANQLLTHLGLTSSQLFILRKKGLRVQGSKGLGESKNAPSSLPTLKPSNPQTLKPSICFVAPNNYAALSGRTDLPQIGGAEVQRALLAHELVRRGFKVSFVTLDHGQPDGIEHDGIRVFKMCALDDGLPGLRFIHPRWTSLNAAMARANADVYYQRTYGVETGQVALWCRRHCRKMIAGIANDRDCHPHLEGQANLREKVLYKYGLKRANLVVAQTFHQQRLLAMNFGLPSRVIRSCAPRPVRSSPVMSVAQRLAQPRILWIARFSPQKRLEWLPNLAAQFPDAAFDVVGNGQRPNDPAKDALTRLETMRNVTLHGFIPHAQVGAFYERAALLLCTSAYEGYPNTFIEAWSRGIPTISTVDPDNVIASGGLGAVAETPAELAAAVREFLHDSGRWTRSSSAAEKFFAESHTIEGTGDAYESLLME